MGIIVGATVVYSYFNGSVRPRLLRGYMTETRLFNCAEKSNKRVNVSLLQGQIDDGAQMCE